MTLPRAEHSCDRSLATRQLATWWPRLGGIFEQCGLLTFPASAIRYGTCSAGQCRRFACMVQESGQGQGSLKLLPAIVFLPTAADHKLTTPITADRPRQHRSVRSACSCRSQRSWRSVCPASSSCHAGVLPVCRRLCTGHRCSRSSSNTGARLASWTVDHGRLLQRRPDPRPRIKT